MLLKSVFILILFTNNHLSAQKTVFTSSDALNIVSDNLRDMTDDGRYLVMTSATRKDRLGQDHKRFRDPSYVAPSYSLIKIVDTRTKESWPVFDKKVILSGLDISPDNSQLALLVYNGNDYQVFLYDLAKRKLKQLKLS